MNPKDHAQDELIIVPQAMTNSATVTSNFDIQGKGSYATIRVAFASEASTSAVGPSISLLESDDTVVSNFATITADRTGEAVVTSKQVVYHVDLRGRKRYLRLSVSTGTNATHDNQVVAANGTIHHMGTGPNSTTGMVVGTNDVAVVV
jgi:hypothetical protein